MAGTISSKAASEQQMIVSESTFVATQPDGKRVEADGVDLFTVRDGKITRKQAFRKQRPPFDPR